MNAGEDLCDLLVVRSEKKGRLQQVFCYRDENWRIGSGGEEGKVCVSCLLVTLAGKKAPSGVGCWDKAMSSGRKARRGRAIGCTGNGNRVSLKTVAGILLQNWG